MLFRSDEGEPVVTLVTSNDRRYTATVPFPYGSPANPLPDDQLIAKFRDLSGAILPSQRLDEIVATILDLDNMADVRNLPALLKPVA